MGVTEIHCIMTVMDVESAEIEVGVQDIKYKNEIQDELWNLLESPPNTQLRKPSKAMQLRPIEGSWRLIANDNYDEVLDKQWKIMTETCVKAKSMRGYKTKSFKMTSNKFRLNEAKPELLEDWDPRLVVTTVTLESNENGDVIHMDQIAEKDMAYKRDSHTTYECCGDILTCTVDCITSRGTVRGVRKFVRHTPQKNGTVRKMSAPF